MLVRYADLPAAMRAVCRLRHVCTHRFDPNVIVPALPPLQSLRDAAPIVYYVLQRFFALKIALICQSLSDDIDQGALVV